MIINDKIKINESLNLNDREKELVNKEHYVALDSRPSHFKMGITAQVYQDGQIRTFYHGPLGSKIKVYKKLDVDEIKNYVTRLDNSTQDDFLFDEELIKEINDLADKLKE